MDSLIPVRVIGVGGSGYLSLVYYENSGSYTSMIYDTIYNNSFSTVSWTPFSQPQGTDFTIKIRTCDDSLCAGEENGGAGTKEWDSCDNATNGEDISALNCVTDGDRYIQYYVTLSSNSSRTQSPSLDRIAINYIQINDIVSQVDSSLTNNCCDFESSAIIDVFDPTKPYIKKTYEGGMGTIVGDYIYRKREGSYIEILKLFDRGTLLEK